MARGALSVRRLLLAVAVAAAVAVALASWDRRAARELLPDGARVAVELHGAGRVLAQVDDTRFAAAFAAGPTYSWLERSEAVRVLDDLRAAIGRVTGFTPGRRGLLLDLVGTDAAAAWYSGDGPPPQPDADVPWITAGRLSLRGWALAAAGRAALRAGLLGAGVTPEDLGGTTVVTVGAGAGAIRLFVSGRLLVVGSNPDLTRQAARLAGGAGDRALTGSEDWRRVAAALPEGGTLRLFARGGRLPQWTAGPSGAPPAAAGAVVAAGQPVTVDVFVDAPGASARLQPGAKPPLPLALTGIAPLLSHAAAGPPPAFLADFLAERAAAVARRQGVAGAWLPALGDGFALAITSVEEAGLFPRPHGLLAIAMRDGAAAQEALRRLFPPDARSATAGRWGTALSTRESLPLAGEFDLWGAAAGGRLVLATQPALIEALGPDAAPTGAVPALPAGAALESVSAIDVARLLPAVRRYAAPVAGLLRARQRGLPDVARDLELIAAVRTAGVAAGWTQAGSRSRITLAVGDLPAR
ncbi:MAG TPA: hypothetical protein VI078_16830 [bacterium]